MARPLLTQLALALSLAIAAFLLGRLSVRDDAELNLALQRQEAAVRALAAEVRRMPHELDTRWRVQSGLRELARAPAPPGAAAQAAPAGSAAQNPPAGTATPPSEETAAGAPGLNASEVAARLAQSSQLIDEATRRGSWSASDSERLQATLFGLESDARQQVFQRLSQTINAGKIALTPGSVPF